MTEAEKRTALASIALRTEIAERTGNLSTAKSWRDLYATVEGRKAEDIILAKRIEERPEQ